MNFKKIVNEKRGTIIDVRTPMEFSAGNAEGSINIPLQELESRKEELKTMKKPLILCCASGGRSAQATQYLKQQGIDCYNGGSWLEINYYQTQTV